jgi:PHD/YefM family antitoxin component YafN of YafNO toxin-antitoxin module
MPTTTTRADKLPAVPASDVKKRGWRGLMRTLVRDGAVVVTNHEEPEAVILRVDAYEALVDLVEQTRSRAATELDALRQRFDERLAALRAPDAGDRLRALARRPARLGGKVKAGKGF